MTDKYATSGLAAAPAAEFSQRHFDPEASIVLVGCRGAGKRSLGFIGALHLRRRLVTEDHYFEQVTGQTRAQYLQQHGREDFVRRSAEVFRQMLAANSRRCIIECGLSSLTAEAQSVLRAYCHTHPVIYVHREREQILRFLDVAEADQLLRADESHRQCSNLEYFNLYDDSGRQTVQANGSNGTNGTNGSIHSVLNGTSPESGHGSSPRLLCVKEDFANYLDLLQGQTWQRHWAESPFLLNALPPEFRARSFALRLRLSYLVDMDLEWEDFEARGDCVELIIDHWPDDLFNVIARQVALIRRKLALPIIYSVEENPREERSRPAEERDRMDAALLELGLRLNVEYISLDLQRNSDLVKRILDQRGRTAVIGNFWFPGMSAPPWTSEVHVHNYEHAVALGCNIVRIERFHHGSLPLGDPTGLRTALEQLIPDPKPPLVAYDYSILGLCTPLQSRILSPVKHVDAVNRRDHLATVCTTTRAMAQLFLRQELNTLEFYTIGSHVAYSIMPAINMAAFAFTGLQHMFRALPCSTLDDLNQLFLAAGTSGNETFGGATLAAPFKMIIPPHLKLQSRHAAALGAVNVILPLRGRPPAVLQHVQARNRAGPCQEFYGDNTDWRSIYKCLQRTISPRNAVQPSRTTGLVVGAGGMARAAIYALLQLGCRHIFIYNRTRAHAVDVAQHFNDWAQAQGQPLAAGGVNGSSNGSNGNSSNGNSNSSSSNGTPSPTICRVLDSMTDPWPADHQPPTMVVSCVPAINTDGSPAADFEIPRQWLTSPTGGVVVELAYDLVTPLMAQMKTLQGNASSPAWAIVDGLQVACEMAIEAFELFTGRMAPKRLMKTVCQEACREQQQKRQQQQQQQQQLQQQQQQQHGTVPMETDSRPW